MSKAIAQSLSHLAIDFTQPHFQLILFSLINNIAKALSPYLYFRACDKFQNAQPGTFREAKNY